MLNAGSELASTMIDLQQIYGSVTKWHKIIEANILLFSVSFEWEI